MNRALPAPIGPPTHATGRKYDADLSIALSGYFRQVNAQLNSQVQGFGAAIASATTITLTNANHHITGTNAVKTINVPAAFSGPVFLVADGAFSLTTGGNIAVAAGPFTAGQLVVLSFDPAKNTWAPILGTGGGGGGAPVNATYATIAAEAGLPNSRRLAAGANITFADGGPGGSLTISSTGGGVTSLIAGKDIAVSSATGAVTVTNTMFHPFLLMGA